MREEIFRFGDITVIVASRTRRTTITQAIYRKALQEAFPEIVEFEQEALQYVAPQEPDYSQEQSSDRRAMMKKDFQAKYDDFVNEMSKLRARLPVGAAYTDASRDFLRVLSRIKSIKGAEFNLQGEGNTSRFPDDEVLVAFNDYLEDEGDLEGFWSGLYATIVKVDAPLTGAEEKPPETLSEAEKEDPLLEGIVDYASDR